MIQIFKLKNTEDIRYDYAIMIEPNNDMYARYVADTSLVDAIKDYIKYKTDGGWHFDDTNNQFYLAYSLFLEFSGYNEFKEYVLNNFAEDII